MPKDTDTIADIGTKVFRLKKHYMSCDAAEKMQLEGIWDSLHQALQKLKNGLPVKDKDEDDDYSEDDNLPSNEERADDDGDYMGSYYNIIGSMILVPMKHGLKLVSNGLRTCWTTASLLKKITTTL